MKIMPPKPKFSKEEIIAAAVDIIRESNVDAITAQEIARRMGTSTRPMFTYFHTLEELREAATVSIREIYNTYAERGLSMTPSFKGFAMEYIRFAMDEPGLFRLLFLRKNQTQTLQEFLNTEGHFDRVCRTIMETFRINAQQALWLYENLWAFAHGLATMCACETVVFSQKDISSRLGLACRGLLMLLHAPEDERTTVMPGADVTITGTVEEYWK